jgi:hypothetical protein
MNEERRVHGSHERDAEFPDEPLHAPELQGSWQRTVMSMHEASAPEILLLSYLSSVPD